jgi:hypothetical protein
MAGDFNYIYYNTNTITAPAITGRTITSDTTKYFTPYWENMFCSDREEELKKRLNESLQKNKNRKKQIRNLDKSNSYLKDENELLRKTVCKLLELNYGKSK